MSGIEKIFLTEMAKIGVHLASKIEMIVDNEADAGLLRDRHDIFRHFANGIERRSLGPKLNQIGATLAELARHTFRRSTVKVCSIDEAIEPALGKRFQLLNLRICSSAHHS